ncbi:MAG: hypothetical protein HXS52_03650 [Theionarchaea archaeon]|nr:hypothetical protein [Theionarchaea archaeon]MBU7037002.1 hypothetical protein [Theionarchaea archaeon]
MRTMGEIMGAIDTMQKERMPHWLQKNELQVDVIEKDLLRFARWLLEEKV